MKLVALIMVSGGLLISGCEKADQKAREMTPKTTDFGTGLNAVQRTYAKPVAALFEVVSGILTRLDLKVETSDHDALGGEIVAKRADGHKVTAKITSVDEDHTQVEVRVAPGNRNLAELIQQRIAEKLGIKENAKPQAVRPTG